MSIDDQVATLFEHDEAAKKLCFVDHDYIWNQISGQTRITVKDKKDKCLCGINIPLIVNILLCVSLLNVSAVKLLLW